MKNSIPLVDKSSVQRVNDNIYVPKDVRPKILHLTLHKKWFDEILAETKKSEHRMATLYWMKRLHGRDYDYIHFVNGYGKDRPWMDVEFIECVSAWGEGNHPEYKIKLGKILRQGNIK